MTVTVFVPERKELTSSAVRKRLVPDRAVSAEGFGRRSNVPRWREKKVVSQLLYAAPVRVCEEIPCVGRSRSEAFRSLQPPCNEAF